MFKTNQSFMRYIFIVFSTLFISFYSSAQDEEPRYLNEEFHKVTLQVISVVPQSKEHAVVLIKEVNRTAEKSTFKPLVGEYVMVTFYYTTKPTRQQQQFKDLGFDFPGVKPGDIIKCQLLGNPSRLDASRSNWKVFEYVVTGRDQLPQSSDD